MLVFKKTLANYFLQFVSVTFACRASSVHVLSCRTETNEAPPSPYLSISSDGLVSFQNNHMLISTCRMHVYKFPFDTQSCNLSFKSILHPSEFSSLSSLEHSKQKSTYWTLFPSSSVFLFSIFHTRHRNTAGFLSQLLRDHGHDDADPVRVAVHQHEGHQQNRLHDSPQTRLDDLHCTYASTRSPTGENLHSLL